MQQLVRRIDANQPLKFKHADKVGACLGHTQKAETVVEKWFDKAACRVKGFLVATSQGTLLWIILEC